LPLPARLFFRHGIGKATQIFVSYRAEHNMSEDSPTTTPTLRADVWGLLRA
jgi:hypothetical protein